MLAPPLGCGIHAKAVSDILAVNIVIHHVLLQKLDGCRGLKHERDTETNKKTHGVELIIRLCHEAVRESAIHPYSFDRIRASVCLQVWC